MPADPAHPMTRDAKEKKMPARNAAVAHPSAPSAVGLDLLDAIAAELDAGAGEAALERLATALAALRQSRSSEWWNHFVTEVCKPHALYERLDADPFTRRARDQPRGYPGDAVLLDYVYHGLPAAEQAGVSDEGRAIFAFTAGRSGSAEALRQRRDFLARELDRTGAEHPAARVLAVAAGHLREAALSSAVRDEQLGELVALDQDGHSLAEVERSGYGACVRTHAASVGALIKGSLDLGTFDLIYAPGLYDYLPAHLGRLLTSALVARLRPGGQLLLGNFAAGFASQAFMEAFQAWSLIGRTHEEMAGLFADVPAGALRQVSTFIDSGRHIVYARVERA